jgi:hypothetical protein
VAIGTFNKRRNDESTPGTPLQHFITPKQVDVSVGSAALFVVADQVEPLKIGVWHRHWRPNPSMPEDPALEMLWKRIPERKVYSPNGVNVRLNRKPALMIKNEDRYYDRNNQRISHTAMQTPRQILLRLFTLPLFQQVVHASRANKEQWERARSPYTFANLADAERKEHTTNRSARLRSLANFHRPEGCKG